MIYLDHHAATPLSARVQQAIADAHRTAWANPSSVHAAGRAARAQLEQTRRALAAHLNVQPADVVLTAGGTEACNLGVLGLARGGRVVTSAREHPAVLASAGPGSAVILPESLEELLQPDDALVALQWVNHETGEIAPVESYARICQARGVPLFVDACQALGKLPVDLGSLGASAVAFGASKVGGPASAGALWVERRRQLDPRILGGPQERGRRAGTLDAAAMAGFGAALEALPARLADQARLGVLRDRLEQACLALGAVANHPHARVATVTNVSFRGWRSEILIAALDVEGLCASAGAACSSGVSAGSPVLAALYPHEPWRAASALRLSLGPETTEEDVTRTIAVLHKVIRRA
jgi:cysteine desulfurase